MSPWKAICAAVVCQAISSGGSNRFRVTVARALKIAAVFFIRVGSLGSMEAGGCLPLRRQARGRWGDSAASTRDYHLRLRVWAAAAGSNQDESGSAAAGDLSPAGERSTLPSVIRTLIFARKWNCFGNCTWVVKSRCQLTCWRADFNGREVDNETEKNDEVWVCKRVSINLGFLWKTEKNPGFWVLRSVVSEISWINWPLGS